MRTVTWECSGFSPLSEEDDALEKRWALEALMQFHAQGDQPPNGCGNGHILALTTASSRLTLAGQQVQGDTSVTTPADVYRHAVHPLFITGPVTGEEEPTYFFIAVLPCSWYTYAEACTDMKTEEWLLCHVHAYNYLGGVTRLRILDNCKTATTSNTRYETVLNQSCQALSDHYGTAIVPACVRKPDDKATAEGSLRFIFAWITAALRDRKLFTLAKANAGVAE